MSEAPFKWPDDWENIRPEADKYVRALCLLSGIPTLDAEGVYGEVCYRFAKACIGGAEFASPRKALAWIGTVALNLIRSDLKRMKRLGTRESIERVRAEFHSSSPPKFSGDFQEYLDLVDDPEQKEVLNLKILHDLSFREIAEELSISAGKAHNLYKAALQRLKSQGGEP
jgi:RNA polymerase sigma factor (sigma-70 family)